MTDWVEHPMVVESAAIYPVAVTMHSQIGPKANGFAKRFSLAHSEFHLSYLCLIIAILSLLLINVYADAEALVLGPESSSYLATINAPHRARLIDNNIEALENFLQVIGRARKTITVEAFVFNPDRSGRLVLQALARKASEGVKVRILVDYYSNRLKSGLDGFYFAALARHGIELRYFNVANLMDLGKIGFRNHRKFLIVDENELVMGGRNIADEYFGMAERVNYLDRDVWLEGPIVHEAARHFELYWESPIVSLPKLRAPPVFARSSGATSSKLPRTIAQDKSDFAAQLVIYEGQLDHARKAFVTRPADEALKSQVSRLGQALLAMSPIVEVNSVTIACDQPMPGEVGRVVTPYLFNRLKKAEDSLLIENFLFLCMGEEKDLLLSLLGRHVRIDLLTNGLRSDPNFIMAELANSRQNMAVERGMNVFCFFDAAKEDKVFCGKKSVWGLHTKSIVIDGRDSVIGSHNFDPRSAWINSEGIIIINNSPEFAALLEGKIRKRIKNATRMNVDGSYANGYHCNSAGRVLTIILRPLAEIFTDLL